MNSKTLITGELSPGEVISKEREIDFRIPSKECFFDSGLTGFRGPG